MISFLSLELDFLECMFQIFMPLLIFLLLVLQGLKFVSKYNHLHQLLEVYRTVMCLQDEQRVNR